MYRLYLKNSRLSTNIMSIFIIILMLVLISVVTIKFLNKIESYTKNHIGEALETVLKTTQGALRVWADLQIIDITELSTNPKLLLLTQKLISQSKDIKNKSLKKREDNTKKFLNTAIYQNSIATLLIPHLNLRHFKNFLIVSDKKQILASMRTQTIGDNILFSAQREPFIQRALNGEIVLIPPTKIDPNKKTYKFNNAGIFIVAPIKNQSGKVIALLSFEMDPWKHFTQLTQLGRIGKSGETYAFNKDGVLISMSRFDDQLREIGLITKNSSSLLSIKITDPSINLLENPIRESVPQDLPLTLMAQSAITSGAGKNTEGYHDYRGVEVFGAWLWDENLGIGLTTEIDVAEALIPFNSARNIILISLLIITILFIAFVMFVIRSHIKKQYFLKQENDRNEALVTERTKELSIAKNNLELVNIELSNLVKIDSLTQLANRRHFDDHLHKEIQRCARDKKPLSLLFMDIDYFKRYNDRYGHTMGDECLKQVSKALKKLNFENRPGDLISRYGGEEFTVILSGAENNYAIKCAQRIINAMGSLKRSHSDSDAGYVTLSIGIATSAPVLLTQGKVIIDNADQALYQAKNNGRNQYFNYSDNTHETLTNKSNNDNH